MLFLQNLNGNTENITKKKKIEKKHNEFPQKFAQIYFQKKKSKLRLAEEHREEVHESQPCGDSALHYVTSPTRSIYDYTNYPIREIMMMAMTRTMTLITLQQQPHPPVVSAGLPPATAAGTTSCNLFEQKKEGN